MQDWIISFCFAECRYKEGVEILTPQHSDHENKRALVVQRKLHIVGTGGSDSHEIDHVGTFITYFPTTIGNEQDLAQAIREGNCRPLFRRDVLWRAHRFRPGTFENPRLRDGPR
ncbi:MAG: hypothetical protein JSW15_06765 [Deltaproteobacteria bacterium]|nr:MAG: hypothetical protein JSW15_06765 [Deltaproteobacteria bacterium]